MISVYYLDDEPALCEIFEAAFASKDIRITTFTVAQDAIDACQDTPPDAIFIDLRLDDTTGDEVASILPDTIIKYLVTGDFINTSDFQFKEVLTKPFDMSHIQSILDSLRTS